MPAKIVLIVQARMGSTRLPGKSLMPLAGKALLQHVLERAKLARLPSEVVLATTENAEDDALVDLAQRLDVQVYRGHEHDLMARYYHAALQYEADIVVRIPADNPLIHPEEIDRIIEYFLTSDLDYASNLGPYLNNGYPDGLGAEVMSMQALTYLYQHIDDAHHREHVTSIFRDEPERFKVGSVQCPQEFSRPDIVLDINTRAEYDYMAALFNDLAKEKHLITIHDVIAWVDTTQLVRE